MNAFVRGLFCCLLALCAVPAVRAAPGPKQPADALSLLAERAAQCELDAVADTLQTSRGAPPDERTRDALRVAAGRCTRFLLALVHRNEVTQVCASLEAWSAAQTARELRRRIAAIEADRLLGATAIGQACRAAYLHELKTTRVVLQSRRR